MQAILKQNNKDDILGLYMIVVINAGGSGTRLWPLSTPEYPKHLLKIIGENSLLQEAYSRAKKLSNNIYIVTEGSHAEHVKSQLPELDEDAFIIEPARRGTAGCLIAGLEYVGKRHDKEEPIAFLHADHVIRDIEGFTYSFELAGEASREQGRITLIGIEPTSPSSAFGYVQKDTQMKDGGLVYSVKGFKEKPDFETAKQYLKSGKYLWNCGYFVGSVATFENALKQFSPEWYKSYQQLVASDESSYKDVYMSFENDAIDYMLMEKTPDLLVVPATFDWMDVGSFSDVHTAVETDEAGNHINCQKIALEGVENSLIINQEEGKQVGVIGLDNIIVINTPHGLLVARKDLDQKVKDIVNQLKENNK